MKKIKGVQVIDLTTQSDEEAVEVIAKAFEAEWRRKRKAEMLAGEMAVLSAELHHGTIEVAERFGVPVKKLMFAAVKSLLDMLSEWDESCEVITDEDLADLEELRQQVLKDRESMRTPERDSTTVGETPYGG